MVQYSAVMVSPPGTQGLLILRFWPSFHKMIWYYIYIYGFLSNCTSFSHLFLTKGRFIHQKVIPIALTQLFKEIPPPLVFLKLLHNMQSCCPPSALVHGSEEAVGRVACAPLLFSFFIVLEPDFEKESINDI